MIVVDIKYNKKDEKTYKYLLIAPKGMKINRDKPLIYTTGVENGKLKKQYLYIIDYKIEKELPSVISKQIIVIDNNNNIFIELIEKPSKEIKTVEDSKEISKREISARTKIDSEIWERFIARQKAIIYRSIRKFK